MTLVSPENVNGTLSDVLPPLAMPSALANQAAASDAKLTVQFGEHPVICLPGAAVKTKAPLVRSRVVELASRNTWNPEAVTFVILTLGEGPSEGTSCAVPVTIRGPSVATTSPATLPNWTAGTGGFGVVEFAGMITANRVVPSE